MLRWRNGSKGRGWRTMSLLAAALLAIVAALSGCGQTRTALVDDKVNVVTTFYPLYEFASRIGGEKANVINLVPAGVEPHDWSPKSRDLKHMTQSQLFVYNGAGFEGWVGDFLGSLSANSGLTVVEASAGVELIRSDDHDDHDHDHAHDDHDHDGYEHEEDGHDDHAHDDHGHDDHAHGKDDKDSHAKDDKDSHSHASESKASDSHGHDGHNHGDTDPHVWGSPKSALKMAENIRDGLVRVDPANRAVYDANYDKLHKELSDLDAKFKSELSKAKTKEIVVSHQAFGYLSRDYGLTQMPIMGLSPGSEPTAQDLKAINQFVREHGVKYIFFEELVSDRLAKTLAKDAGIETLVLNPLEGLTREQEKAGDNYVTVMERNLQNLLKALQ